MDHSDELIDHVKKARFELKQLGFLLPTPKTVVEYATTYPQTIRHGQKRHAVVIATLPKRVHAAYHIATREYSTPIRNSPLREWLGKIVPYPAA